MMGKIKNLNIRYCLRTAPHWFFQSVVSGSGDVSKLIGRRDYFQKLRNTLDDKIRILENQKRGVVVRDPSGESQSIPVSVMSTDPPWSRTLVPPGDVPGMITEEESRYYVWLGEKYLGLGDVIELGPWLGKSTLSITEGLKRSGKFGGRKLHVYEDFTWRSSFMNAYVSDNLRMKDDADFLPVFRRMTASREEMIDAKAVAIQKQSWNKHLPDLEWNGNPIEMVFVDCGKAFLENEAWYKVLSPSFIPDTTLIVMQDWRAHRKVPRKPFTQTWQFTESKGRALELVHETSNGDVATFFWRGEVDPHR